MAVREIRSSYPSSDGINSIHTVLYLPDGEPRGIIQLAHGMVDNVGRYRHVGRFFAESGYVFAAGDHLGHGRTARTPDDYGYFAKRDGYKLVIEDIRLLNESLHRDYPHLPLYLIGHSMGSFLTRLYVTMHPDTLDGYICHGTAGKNPAAPFGIALIGIMKRIFGDRHRSNFVRSLADGGYNRRFDPADGPDAWLSRDTSIVASIRDPEIPSFTFTLSGYGDLFRLLRDCNKRAWYEAYPKNMPTIIMSGGDDPVGGFGKGVREVYGKLRDSGVKDLTLKLYPGARHELFNEINTDEVYRDILAWIDGIGGRA